MTERTSLEEEKRQLLAKQKELEDALAAERKRAKEESLEKKLEADKLREELKEKEEDC